MAICRAYFMLLVLRVSIAKCTFSGFVSDGQIRFYAFCEKHSNIPLFDNLYTHTQMVGKKPISFSLSKDDQTLSIKTAINCNFWCKILWIDQMQWVSKCDTNQTDSHLNYILSFPTYWVNSFWLWNRSIEIKHKWLWSMEIESISKPI